MRQHKFRAWDEDNEIMRYSENDGEDSAYGPIVWQIDSEGVHFEEMTMVDECVGGEHEQNYRYRAPNQKIMEFTGLHDKDGKEAYEGDVFKRKFMDDSDIGVIKFKDGAFIVKWIKNTFSQGLIYHLPEAEIIGNIHENPDLLTSSAP
ncbi:MAG: YopX family protein [bacterium]|nr:YopX family protein [bacterium]